MKRLATMILISASLVGCATGGGGPTVVASTPRFVTVYDAMGWPGASLKVAQAHCATYGRYAQYVTKGGDALMCYNQNLCDTYNCIE